MSKFPCWINKRLKIIKKAIIKSIGLIAFKIWDTLICDSNAIIITNIPKIPYPKNPASKKTAINNKSNEPIFNLGSKRWIKLSIGMYFPNIILFIELPSYFLY